MPILSLKLEYVVHYKNVYVMDKQYMTYIDVNISIPSPALQFSWVQQTSVLLGYQLVSQNAKLKEEGIYLCRRPCVIPSVHCTHPSVHIFVRPEPYLSTHWSDLMHSWYESLVPWTADILIQYPFVRFDALLVRMLSTIDSRYPISFIKIDLFTLELLPFS